MSHLQRKPFGTRGKVHEITPATAGWRHVGFSLYRLRPGDTAAEPTAGREVILVLVEGKARIAAAGRDWGTLGQRMSVFEQTPPHALYLPPGQDWHATAETDCILAVCSAPATGTATGAAAGAGATSAGTGTGAAAGAAAAPGTAATGAAATGAATGAGTTAGAAAGTATGAGPYPARRLGPEGITLTRRGEGTNTRWINNIAMEAEDVAESLLVTEVFTPPGNWSSYPSHRHDEDDFPDITYLEETYYHRLNPEDGWALQRIYTDDKSLDQCIAVANHDVTLVPKGHHPCAAPHGMTLYYLNVMAGPKRKWRFKTAPEVQFLIPKT